MKRLLCIVLLLVAACGGGGGGPDSVVPVPEPAPIPAPEPEIIIVQCFGTSLTSGETAGIAWVLGAHEKELNIWVRNRGFGGHSSLDLTAHLEEAASHGDHIVLIETAMNDSYQGLTKDEVRFYVTSIVEAFREHGTRVYLMTTNPELWIPTRHPHLEEYYQLYRDLAAELGVGLIDLHAEWVKVEPRDLSLYIPDNVHPSMEGLEIVVYPTLRDVIKTLHD